MPFRNQTFAVFGLGKAGRGAAEFLLKSGATVYAWDDKEESRNAFTSVKGTPSLTALKRCFTPPEGGGDNDVAVPSLPKGTKEDASGVPSPFRGEGQGEGDFKPTHYTNKALSFAKELRSKMTETEKKLWYHLRAKRFADYKFRRQQPIGEYIVDFVCSQKKLVIELDGGQHTERKAHDKKRDLFLQQEGYRVLRFWNNDVYENLEGVLTVIAEALEQLPDRWGRTAKGTPSLSLPPEGGGDNDVAAYMSSPETTPWSEITALILSPGVPLTHPKPHPVVELAKRHGVPIWCDIELLYQAYPKATYIGITGTNGKSTTTALTGHLLQALGKNVAVGGNIGTAASTLAMEEEKEIYVLEMSSYQLELLEKTRFHIASLLNVTPDHLDRHGDMKGYVNAKRHMFDRQDAHDFAVIAVDDDYTREVADSLKHQQVITVSAYGNEADVVAESDCFRNSLSLRERARVRGKTSMKNRPHPNPLPEGEGEYGMQLPHSLQGRHNAQNLVVAYAMVRALGFAPGAILKAAESYKSLPHRMEWICEKNGVSFVNDSKATNAIAAEQALQTYENIFWIAGGVQKEGGIEPLIPYFSRIAKAYLIGQAQEEFAATCKKGGLSYALCGTLENAVRQAAEDASKAGGGVVLLSPACASFDQFANYEARGDAFRGFVGELH